MRLHYIAIHDDLTRRSLADIAGATQLLEADLGVVPIPNLIMGMQHQLGTIAALMMGDQSKLEIKDTVLGLSAMALVYLKALNTEIADATNGETES